MNLGVCTTVADNLGGRVDVPGERQGDGDRENEQGNQAVGASAHTQGGGKGACVE